MPTTFTVTSLLIFPLETRSKFTLTLEKTMCVLFPVIVEKGFNSVPYYLLFKEMTIHNTCEVAQQLESYTFNAISFVNPTVYSIMYGTCTVA